MPLYRYAAVLFLLVVTLAPLQGRAAPLYTIGFLPGPDFIPTAMNNTGQIAGFVSADDGSHAVVYAGGVLHDLGLGAGSMSLPSAINDAGFITGVTMVDGLPHGFLYQNGIVTDIGANTSGRGINARGDVVGARYTDAGTYGFVYSGGTLTQLPNLGTGRQGVATDINDHGDIAGWSYTDYESSPPPLHSYLYRDGALHDIGTLGNSFEIIASDINNAGDITGSSKVGDDDHVFVYAGGVLKDLGSFGGRNLGVTDLNEHGTLIGDASTANGATVPFVNIGDTLVDLNTLVDPALGWTIYDVYANNDLGQIVGTGCQGDTCGVVRLDLADPVPEPAAAWLLAPGLLCLAWRRRRNQWPAWAAGRCATLGLSAALLAPLHGHAAALYTVQLLPQSFNPSDINNAGQMAGTLYAADGRAHAAIYSGGVVTDLGTFGGAYSYATAINDAGMVAGNFDAPSGIGHGFLYRAGAMTDIGAVNALAINAGGDVVGQFYNGAGYTGFLYRQGAITALGYLGTGDTSLAAGINDAGQIVGESNIDSALHAPSHPWLYDAGALHDLGTLAGREVNSAVAINNAGQIAGYSESENGGMHAFFYEHGVMTDLGSFGGLDVTIGGMNQLGQVVGTGNTWDGPDIPFITRAGALVDLNTLIDPASGWLITTALDINDRGQIAANACRDSLCSPVLLNLASPVPEPGALLLWLAGAAALAGWRQWRAHRRKKTAAPCGCGGSSKLQRWYYASRPARLRSFSFR